MALKAIKHKPSSPSIQMSNLSKLVKRGREAATLWDECDTALVAVNETFGEPFEKSRNDLNSSLLAATARELDVDTFKGDDNPLRFEDLKILVVVRPSLLPVPDKKLENIDIRIEKAERELKLLKAKRKSILEELKIKGHEFIVEKVTTAFRHIK